MSTISPDSLLYLTVDAVAKNYQFLCQETTDYVECQDGDGAIFSKLVFKGGYSLPPNISEQLLLRMIETQNNTNDTKILSLFVDPDVCPLRRFCTGDISAPGDKCDLSMALLKRQRLVDLDICSGLSIFEEDFSKYIISTTLKRLTVCPVNSLDLHFIKTFYNLRHLDVSNSKLIGDLEVGMFAALLLSLESLDVSSTDVQTVEAFGILTVKLKSLNVHNTPLIIRDISGTLQFSNLELLDISRQIDDRTECDEFQQNMLSQFFSSPDKLLSLVFLDLSGAGKIDNMALKRFVESHKKLRFLGLLNVEQTVYSVDNIPVEIASDGNVEQVLSCLKRYQNRPRYLVQAMNELFRFSSENSLKENVQKRKMIVELLLQLMTKYMCREYESLHMAASKMVSVLIQVLKTFPDHKQIQHHCLIILFNNYVLSKAAFDRFLLSELIFKAITLFSGNSITDLALKMCAYLSSEISVEETLMLGTRENIKRLLNIIRLQVSSSAVNSLLLSALRVLWNLTDEAPKTCHLVMELNGLPLIIKALQTFDNVNKILTKLLGILNNLAEVVPIRPRLMTNDVLSLLRKYLDNCYRINVSYFAAGITCNLAIDWPADLQLACGTLTDFLRSVGAAVGRWSKITQAMVGYRTFRSFIPLMRSHFPDCQLWAVWAIHHVCSQKVERYAKICNEEGIVDILKNIWNSPETRADVVNLAMEATNAVERTNDDDSMSTD